MTYKKITFCVEIKPGGMNNLKNETKTVETTTNWDENYTSGTTKVSQIKPHELKQTSEIIKTYLPKCL